MNIPVTGFPMGSVRRGNILTISSVDQSEGSKLSMIERSLVPHENPRARVLHRSRPVSPTRLCQAAHTDHNFGNQLVWKEQNEYFYYVYAVLGAFWVL